MAQGNRDAAAEAFRRASELDPENPWPLNNLGYLYLVTGGQDEARAPLERAVEIDPEHATAWSNLALALEHAGELEHALHAARRAEALSPDSARRAATAERLAALAPPAAPSEAEVQHAARNSGETATAPEGEAAAESTGEAQVVAELEKPESSTR
jgi:tetratricopeptide (TPR) repeat protein